MDIGEFGDREPQRRCTPDLQRPVGDEDLRAPVIDGQLSRSFPDKAEKPAEPSREGRSQYVSAITPNASGQPAISQMALCHGRSADGFRYGRRADTMAGVPEWVEFRRSNPAAVVALV